MGLFLVWRHRLICIVVSLCKHTCKKVCDIKPGIGPYPFNTCSVVQQMMARFLIFLQPAKSQVLVSKRGKMAQCISNRCKDLFKWKSYLGVGLTLILTICFHSSASTLAHVLVLIVLAIFTNNIPLVIDLFHQLAMKKRKLFLMVSFLFFGTFCWSKA